MSQTQKNYHVGDGQLPNGRQVRGCRSPNSKGNGHWDGAFIFSIDNNGNTIGAIFEDNRDYISNYIEEDGKLVKPTLDFFIKEYNDKLSHGWIDMQVDDIKLTCGIEGSLYVL